MVVGYALVGQALPLASHAHVLELQGLAVDPARQRCGAGRRLVEASVEQARDRGARKLALRVLGNMSGLAACMSRVDSSLRAYCTRSSSSADVMWMTS